MGAKVEDVGAKVEEVKIKIININYFPLEYGFITP